MNMVLGMGTIKLADCGETNADLFLCYEMPFLHLALGEACNLFDYLFHRRLQLSL